MNKIDIYIAKEIIKGSLMALAVLTALDVFFALVNELEDIGQGQYQYADAFVYIVLTLPFRIYEMFPAAILVGSLLSLGAMASNSELVAIRAAGVSVMRVVRSAAQAGALLMLVVIFIGEILVPPAESLAQFIQSSKKDVQVSQSLASSGIWIRDDNHFIRITKVFPGLQLHGVHIYTLDDEFGMQSMHYADAALQAKGYWQLRNIKRSRFLEEGVENQSLEVERWPTGLKSDLLDILKVDPEKMSAFDLWHYVNYLDNNSLESSTYRLAFWLKIVTPLSCVIMMLIVMPFVFGSLRAVSAGQLLVVGILLGLTFYILIQLASRVGQIYGIPPFISATFPMLIFSLVGLMGLAKVR